MAGKSLEEIQRIVDHYRKSADIEAQRAFGAARYVNGGAYYRRSPDGNMEARMSREFRKMPHKVGSRKSLGRVGHLQTLAGLILHPIPVPLLSSSGFE